VNQDNLSFCAICNKADHKSSKCGIIKNVFQDMDQSRIWLREQKARIILRNKFHEQNNSDFSWKKRTEVEKKYSDIEIKPSVLARRKSFIGSDEFSSFEN
jgi:hypothetical protein